MKKLIILALMAAAVLVSGSAMAWENISLEELSNLVDKKPVDGSYTLVDSRPEIKYIASYIPWATSIPFQDLKDDIEMLPENKDGLLVFYCGGKKCDLSKKSAELAEKNGYTNVKVFIGGEPAWRESGRTPWVATGYLKMLLNDQSRVALVVDARPSIKYVKGTVPGAINIPFPSFKTHSALLPRDKDTQVIFFCGGLKCDLSHKSAAKTRELGYTDVRVYAEGWPAWKKDSKRAFAIVDPKNPTQAPTTTENEVFEGEIKADEFKKVVSEQNKDVLIVDTRPTEEFEAAHITGAINIPDGEIEARIAEIKSAKKVVFYCNTGSRAAVAYYTATDAKLDHTVFLNREVTIEKDGSFKVN